MPKSPLQVSPELLEQGSNDLRNHHRTMSESVSAIADRYAELTDLWTGAAADATTKRWEELQKILKAHVDKLEEHAKSLSDNARQFAQQESSNQQDIKTTGGRLT